jgi:hypothetical protein
MLPTKKFLSKLRRIPPVIIYVLFQAIFIMAVWLFHQTIASDDLSIRIPYYLLVLLGSIVASLGVATIVTLVWCTAILLLMFASIWYVHNMLVSKKLDIIRNKQITFGYWVFCRKKVP